MKLLRCRICGETYLGTGAPDRCPFCGAGEQYFVPAEQYPADVNSVDLTEVELADLQTAIGLERGNARFYAALGGQAGSPTLQSAYKRLSAIEAEHCSVFCKLAGVTKPSDLREPSSSAGDWCADIADSLAREQRASAFYAEAARRASSERVREVLAAVSAVEIDHIEVDGLASRLAGC